jgi:glyoxylase-like metal-dependent hydrolase (beta-lactamase superfamily II)
MNLHSAAPVMHRRSLLAAAAVAPWCLSGPPARADDSAAIEVEAGVYMLAGLPGAPSPANAGRIGNAGFIVGRSGVMAIDTGTSHQHGQALLAAIDQTTKLPVRLLLVTHVRQEFVFGASAFQARGIPVHMQRHAAALMAARCDNCLKTLSAELGEDAMRGTVVLKPDQLFDESHVIETIGRPVLVQHHGHASGPGETSAFDVRSGTLFAGGLLDNRRFPDIQDSDLDGWRQALGNLRSLRINTIVPGHGSAGGPELIADTQRYLAQLEQRCAMLLKQGAALSEVPDAATLPDFNRWDQADGVHRRNAAVMFLRLERRLLLDEPPQGASR